MIEYILLFLSSVLLGSISQILLKKNSENKFDRRIDEYLSKYSLCAYSLFFISTILAILGFKGIEYKFGSILDSAGYIFILILGYFFLNEKITKRKIIGNILIILGILICFLW